MPENRTEERFVPQEGTIYELKEKRTAKDGKVWFQVNWLKRAKGDMFKEIANILNKELPEDYQWSKETKANYISDDGLEKFDEIMTHYADDFEDPFSLVKELDELFSKPAEDENGQQKAPF